MNKNKGGGGSDFCSEETKLKISSPERNKKISEKLRGKKHSKTHKNKYIPLSELVKYRISESNSKPIYQFDFEGNFVREWNSASKAERIIRNKPDEIHRNLPNNINHCCRGKSDSAYGFYWSYIKEFHNSDKRRNTAIK